MTEYNLSDLTEFCKIMHDGGMSYTNKRVDTLLKNILDARLINQLVKKQTALTKATGVKLTLGQTVFYMEKFLEIQADQEWHKTYDEGF